MEMAEEQSSTANHDSDDEDEKQSTASLCSDEGKTTNINPFNMYSFLDISNIIANQKKEKRRMTVLKLITS